MTTPQPQLTQSKDAEDFTDLGHYVTATNSTEDIKNNIQAMSEWLKYNLLKKHDGPSKFYIFFTSFYGGYNRSFKYSWLEKYGPWLVYSKKVDRAFCVYCALFTHSNEWICVDVLVNSPFIKWHKMSEVIGNHEGKACHQAALWTAQAVHSQLKSLAVRFQLCWLQNSITENRHIIKSVSEAVLYCGCQCIGLRGYSEDGNPGSILALMRLLANYDDILKQDLEKPKLRNAT